MKTIEIINDLNFEYASIFTDALSVLQAISANPVNKCSSYPILEVKKADMNSAAKIQLYWIPSHVGIDGNKRADCFAKEAMQSDSLVNLPVTHSDIKVKLVAKFKETHFQHLENIDTFKGTYDIDNFITKYTKTLFHSVSYSRRHLVTIIRLCSNHHSLYESYR